MENHDDTAREIPKRMACPRLTDDQIRRITGLCFNYEPLSEPDAIFVFGTSCQHSELADAVLNVLSGSPEALLVLTGGRPDFADTLGNRNHAKAESEILRTELSARHDLSPFRILIETRSQNMRENVRFVADAISSHEIHRIAFLAHSFAMGRAAMTIRATLPTISVGGTVGLSLLVKGKHLRATNWSGDKLMRNIVWAEFLRIVRYSRRGDIAPCEKRGVIEDLTNQLRL